MNRDQYNKIWDELGYIYLCVGKEYTGEAKSEISELRQYIESQNNIEQNLKKLLGTVLAEAWRELLDGYLGIEGGFKYLDRFQEIMLDNRP